MAQSLVLVASVMMGVIAMDSLETPLNRARRALRQMRNRRSGR
jgi:hypothetical protein